MAHEEPGLLPYNKNMNRSISALSALLLPFAVVAALSAAQAPAFEPYTVQVESLVPAAFRVIKGTYAEKPANRVRNASGSVDTLVVQLDEAKTWDQADRACAALSPAGNFKLPDPTQHLVLTMAGVNPGLTSSTLGGNTIYPLWVRGSTDAETAKHFRGTSNALVLTDGKGMDAELMDLSDFVKRLISRRDELPHRTWDEDIIRERLAVEELLSRVEPGLPVYCVK